MGNIGAGTLIWKKDNRLISAGAMMVRKDPRLRLEGYNLTLAEVRIEDEGEYICEVETFSLEPIQQTSILTVLIPAKVETLPHSGHASETRKAVQVNNWSVLRPVHSEGGLHDDSRVPGDRQPRSCHHLGQGELRPA